MKVLITLKADPEDTDNKWLKEAFDEMLKRRQDMPDAYGIYLTDFDAELEVTDVVVIPPELEGAMAPYLAAASVTDEEIDAKLDKVLKQE